MSSEKEKKEPRLFTKIYQLPSSLGTVSEFSNVTTAIVDREKLKEILSELGLVNQKVMIMFPMDLEKACSNQIYAAQMAFSAVGQNNCDLSCQAANDWANNHGYIVDPNTDQTSRFRCIGTDPQQFLPDVLCCEK